MQHPVAAPPIPERIRTLAAVAAPTHVSVAGSGIPADATRGGVDTSGRPVLLVKPGEALYGTAEEAVVTVDLLATRELDGVDRPRALLKVLGWAQAVPAPEARETAVAIAERCPDEDLFTALEGGAPKLLRVDVAQVIYLAGQESGTLDAEDYLDAVPDPLLDVAERMLRHVNESHPAQLRHTIGRLLNEPAPDAWLWELDRFGATVKSGVDRLIRLPWPSPAATGEELERALACLMCPH